MKLLKWPLILVVVNFLGGRTFYLMFPEGIGKLLFNAFRVFLIAYSGRIVVKQKVGGLLAASFVGAALLFLDHVILKGGYFLVSGLFDPRVSMEKGILAFGGVLVSYIMFLPVSMLIGFIGGLSGRQNNRGAISICFLLCFSIAFASYYVVPFFHPVAWIAYFLAPKEGKATSISEEESRRGVGGVAKISYIIEGILYSQEKPTVIINREDYHLNDSVCGGKIINISRDKVTIQFQEKEEVYRVGDMIRKDALFIAKQKMEREGPASAFQTFHNALYRNNSEIAEKYLSKSTLAKFKKAGFEGKKLSEALVELFPNKLEVIGERIEGNKAFVTAIGEIKSDKPLKFVNEGGVMVPKFVVDAKFTFEMIKEEGEWKIENWER